MAIWKFLGNSLITRLKDKNYANDEEIRETLQKKSKLGRGLWIDLSGMICPFEILENLLESIEKGIINSLEKVNSSIKLIHHNYYRYQWTWTFNKLEKFYGKKIKDFTAEDIIIIVEKWKESVLGIDRMLYEDAKKDFYFTSMINFDMVGQNHDRETDLYVREDFEENPAVSAINAHMQKKEALGNELINRMNNTIINKSRLKTVINDTLR